MPPPFELRKKSRVWQKMQPKCAIFRQKSQKIFWGGGTAPSPDPTPTGEGNTPDQTLTLSSPHPQCRSPRPPPIFFPISIITLDTGAVIDEFGKSNRRLVLLVDLGILNRARLEVGPVNIQSSH